MKRQKNSRRSQKSSYYNLALLWQCLDDFGFASPYALAKHLDINPETTYKVFKGNGTYKHVRPIADFFKVDWSALHDLSPLSPGSHRAVLNGGSRSGR